MNSDLIPEPTQYGDRALERDQLLADPIDTFSEWFAEAVRADVPEANAVCLATVSPDGFPDARIVLMKDLTPRGLAFYTNYESNKGKQLAVTPRAAMVFFWQPIRRQVRIAGRVVRLTPEESDQYFSERPRDSQLGAWASVQSRELSEREVLEARVEEFGLRFPGEVPRPPHWGGFRLLPDRFEFWQGRDNRLHDRFVYTRNAESDWTVQRLMP